MSKKQNPFSLSSSNGKGASTTNPSISDKEIEQTLIVTLGGLMIRKTSEGKYPNVGEIVETIMPLISQEINKAYGRGSVDTLDHVKAWGDKTEITYNKMIADRLSELGED